MFEFKLSGYLSSNLDVKFVEKFFDDYYSKFFENKSKKCHEKNSSKILNDQKKKKTSF